MPLGIANGIPITPQDKAAAGVPLGEMLMGAVTGGQTNSQVLDIEPVTQSQDQWCWAACVQMVSTFFDRAKDQCFVVGLKIKRQNPNDLRLQTPDDCCGAQQAEFGEESCAPNDMGDVWEACNIKSDPRVATDLHQPQRLSFDDIKAQINDEHPIEIGIKWFPSHGGGGHAMIIKGWEQSNGDNLVWINDPLPKSRLHLQGTQGKVLLTELERANNFGLWLHTWTNITKRPE